MQRQVFSYNYSQSWCSAIKTSCHYWFCVKFCCCLDCCWSNRPCRKRRLDKNNYLFKQALGKLYSEIDLLEIIKQMRILRYINTILLNAHQRELVKFQGIYTI